MLPETNNFCLPNNNKLITDIVNEIDIPSYQNKSGTNMLKVTTLHHQDDHQINIDF